MNKEIFTAQHMIQNRELGYNDGYKQGYNMAIKDIVSGVMCIAVIAFGIVLVIAF